MLLSSKTPHHINTMFAYVVGLCVRKEMRVLFLFRSPDSR